LGNLFRRRLVSLDVLRAPLPYGGLVRPKPFDFNARTVLRHEHCGGDAQCGRGVRVGPASVAAGRGDHAPPSTSTAPRWAAGTRSVPRGPGPDGGLAETHRSGSPRRFGFPGTVLVNCGNPSHRRSPGLGSRSSARWRLLRSGSSCLTCIAQLNPSARTGVSAAVFSRAGARACSATFMEMS
jgi:hypothetical protein